MLLDACVAHAAGMRWLLCMPQQEQAWPVTICPYKWCLMRVLQMRQACGDCCACHNGSRHGLSPSLKKGVPAACMQMRHSVIVSVQTGMQHLVFVMHATMGHVYALCACVCVVSVGQALSQEQK
eukprot:1155212-Pelagomonas_calceolata.AAC.3